VEPKPFSLVRIMRRHPLHVALLGACVLSGALIGAHFLPEELSMPRKVLGGALLGGLSWLIPSFGRIIDGR
jgi:hypothetical protein